MFVHRRYCCCGGSSSGGGGGGGQELLVVGVWMAGVTIQLHVVVDSCGY